MKNIVRMRWDGSKNIEEFWTAEGWSIEHNKAFGFVSGSEAVEAMEAVGEKWNFCVDEPRVVTPEMEQAQRIEDCMHGIPYEGTINEVNDYTRQELEDFAEKHGGSVWLGHVNLYDDDTADLQEYEAGDFIYNFGADFVVPTNDQSLVKLIQDRKDMPYTTATNDYGLISTITDYIGQVGGINLFWA